MTSAPRAGYEETIKNLMIQKDTKVICQGFTGKTVSCLFLAKERARSEHEQIQLRFHRELLQRVLQKHLEGRAYDPDQAA